MTVISNNNEKNFYYHRIFSWVRKFIRKSQIFQRRISSYIGPYVYHKAEWGKIQITRIIVVLCAVFVALSNLANKNSFHLLGIGSNLDESVIVNNYQYESSEVFHSLAMAPIADASEAISKEEFQKLKVEGEKATVVSQGLMAINNPSVEEFKKSEQDVYMYIVEEGDTLSTIAQKYSINSNTIRWANGLEDADKIMPGDQLFILPVTGVKHKVKSGDNIGEIAKKYGGKQEEIIAFNNLPMNGELREGDEIIIPDGVVPEGGATIAQRPSQPAITQTPSGIDTQRKFNKQYYSSSAHRFPWGWCTWYVASRRHVPWGGNAGTWLYHAKAYGANIGKTPKAGAIIVTNESRYGHVGIVESVKGNTITISEMNYKGFGVVSKRTLSGSGGVVKGYIY